MQEFVLRNLLAESKDGEWGKGEPADDLIEMKIIRGTDFEAVRIGEVSSIPNRFIPKRIADRKALKPYDILIETAGGSKDRPTGRTLLLTPSFFRKVAFPVTCASFARFLRIDPSKADPCYIFWLLQSMYESRQLLKYHTQHTGVARYQFTTFADNETLTLPDVSIQRRIASILSAYDDLIENNTRRIAILEEMARRIYEEWFVHFRFPGHEKVKMVESELGMIPEGWNVKKVVSAVKRLPAGITYKKESVAERGSVIVIDQSAADYLGFHDSAVDHRASIDAPRIIFGDHTCKLRLLLQPFSVGPNTIPFVGADGLDGIYVYQLLQGLVETREYKRHWTEFSEKQVVLCPPELASRYGDQVKSCLNLAFILSNKNRNLRATRDLLLPKLISGELDVSTLPEPEEAIAA